MMNVFQGLQRRTRPAAQFRSPLHGIVYSLACPLVPPGRFKARLLRRINSGRAKLNPFSENVALAVRDAAGNIYGDHWNNYSNALRPEVVSVFAESIFTLRGDFDRINYLEIGSAQGLSMGVVGVHLQRLGIAGTLISVDPYFTDGYLEEGVHVTVDKATSLKAQRLYRSLNIKVNLIEQTSDQGLLMLINGSTRFSLVYIDGFHSGLQPTLDFGLSYHLLENNGIVIIDDHAWPGVASIKNVCDCHCEKVWECWKAAAYRVQKLGV